MTRKRTLLVVTAAVAVVTATLAAPGNGDAAPPQQPAATAVPAASGPGTWVQLSSGSGIDPIVDPGVHRFGSTLQVVWTQNVSGSKQALRTRILAANGSTASPTTTVLTWAALDEFPALITAAGKRTIVFSGLQDTDTANPYSAGYNYYATSPDGLSWTLADGTIGSSKSAYGSYGSDATNAGGTPVAVFTSGTSNDIWFHTGLDTLPPVVADQTTAPIGKCCSYYAGVAYDAKSGQTWTAWYSNSADSASDGVDAQRIYPTAGTRVHAPSSTSKDGLGGVASVAPDQRVQVAARSGGGLYTAYGIGYPTQSKVALWKLGSTTPMTISTANVAAPGVAAGTGGRLWVFWWEKYSAKLHAVRTNPGATKFGAVCTIATPHKATDVWTTAGDGSNGPLDLVVNAGSSNAQIYATQVLPCLTVHVSPATVKSAKGGTVTVTLSDAGTAVSGAKVRYAGVTKTTNAKGKVAFKVAKGTKKGKKTVSFSRKGYTAGSATFRVS